MDRAAPPRRCGSVYGYRRIYEADLPAHILVFGRFRRSDLFGTRHFVVMRFHLPGVYSMDVCDGRLLPDPSLGLLGDARAPSPDLPVAQAAVGVVIVLALLLVLGGGRGKPAAPAAASAY